MPRMEAEGRGYPRMFAGERGDGGPVGFACAIDDGVTDDGRERAEQFRAVRIEPRVLQMVVCVGESRWHFRMMAACASRCEARPRESFFKNLLVIIHRATKQRVPFFPRSGCKRIRGSGNGVIPEAEDSGNVAGAHGGRGNVRVNEESACLKGGDS